MQEKEEIFSRLKTAPLKKESLRIIEQLERVEPAKANLLDPGLFEMLYCHLADCLFDPLGIRIKWYPGNNLANIVANTPEIRIGMFFVLLQIIVVACTKRTKEVQRHGLFLLMNSGLTTSLLSSTK